MILVWKTESMSNFMEDGARRHIQGVVSRVRPVIATVRGLGIFGLTVGHHLFVRHPEKIRPRRLGRG
jgi:hypothetical protein